MKFKRAISISINNFVNVFKLLVFHLITGALFFGLTYTILSLNLKTIVNSAEAQTVLSLVKNFLLALTEGDVAGLAGFQSNFLAAGKEFLKMLSGMMTPIILSAVGILLLYILSRMVNGLATYTVAIAIDNRMETNGNTKLSTTFFENLPSAIIYQLIYIPLSFLYTVLAAALCWFVFFYALSFLPFMLSLALAATTIFFVQAVKLALISAWIPLIVRDKMKVGKAFKTSLATRKNFWNRFSNFLMCIYTIVIVNVVGAICTFGSFLFVSVPLSYIFVLSLQFVCFYEDSGKKYFISYNKVVNDGEKNLIGEYTE